MPNNYHFNGKGKMSGRNIEKNIIMTNDRIELAKDIFSYFDLKSEDTAFVYGSASIQNRKKIQQNRYFDKDNLLFNVSFKHISGLQDIDLRIISKSPKKHIKIAKWLSKNYKSKYLIELKIDNISYPINDMKNISTTSFFRRVLGLGNYQCLYNSNLLNSLVKIAKDNITYKDINYDNERIFLYELVYKELEYHEKLSLNISSVIKAFPTYFNKDIISNESNLRKVSPLFTIGKIDIKPWIEHKSLVTNL